MASGRHHDRTTALLALPFGLLWLPALGAPGLVVASGGFLLGGLWLSPDLDTRSNATRRWGPLGLLWWPYRRLLSHRSLFSHSPVLGTGLRLAWLAGALLLLAGALAPLGGPPPQALVAAAGRLWQEQRPLLLTALAGLEASTWLHLLQDGDPVPHLPQPLRRLRRRLRRRWR